LLVDCGVSLDWDGEIIQSRVSMPVGDDPVRKVFIEFKTLALGHVYMLRR
jgi:hypothetical protein